jgi:hypothetical protein
MPLNLASPGILVREVDLTVGRIDPVSASVGGIAAPFARGPVDEPTLIESENDLLNTFGRPYSVDKHYEHWMVASSYLAYGGTMQVVRTDSTDLKNAAYGTVPVKVKSLQHYTELGYLDNPLTDVTVLARNPGSWANGIKVSIIDSKADQILTIDSTSGLTVGLGVTQAVPAGTQDPGKGTIDGYFKGIITNVDSANSKVAVKFLSHVSAASTETAKDYQASGIFKFGSVETTFVGTGAGTTSVTVSRGSLGSTANSTISAGTAVTSYYLELSRAIDTIGGTTVSASDTTIGIVTTGISVGADKYFIIGNEIISLASASVGVGQITGLTRAQFGTSADSYADGTSLKYVTRNADVATVTEYVSSSGATNIGLTTSLTPTQLGAKVNANGILSIGSEFLLVSRLLDGSSSLKTPSAVVDWFDQQQITLSSGSKLSWNAVAPRPGTSQFAADRNSRFDELHVVIIDDEGTVTGNSGTILEKHIALSKAKDALYSSGSPSSWRKYLSNASEYIFAGSSPVGIVTTGFSSGYTIASDIDWDQNAQDIIFAGCGALDLKLTGGKNYDGLSDLTQSNSLSATIGEIKSAYSSFLNEEEVDIDFLLMGSAGYTEAEARDLAAELIKVVESRKDAIAFISPYRGSAITDTSSQTSDTIRDIDTITNNVISFYSAIPSSTYAVFDSGYKYMYDRFNSTFRYVPLNGDIAGCCARNDINNFPWYSPAGTARGSILNAVKLAYNPGKVQRDRLYTNRINPVILSPGAGIVLFGDKTGYAKASAFDRINVRRLFVYLENAISAAAKDQLFEFNDELTRTNFVNIVEPFLRDVQSKRGIFDYVVICDETNNTPAIIDANEFVADIYIKPTKSINFIGLTFIATRTGVAFEEVIGNF